MIPPAAQPLLLELQIAAALVGKSQRPEALPRLQRAIQAIALLITFKVYGAQPEWRNELLAWMQEIVERETGLYVELEP